MSIKFENNLNIQVIKSLQGDPLIVQRLYELGFLPGKEVQFKGSTLFGEPVYLQVDDLTVALRKEELDCILT